VRVHEAEPSLDAVRVAAAVSGRGPRRRLLRADGSGWTDHRSSTVPTTDESTPAADGMPAAVTGG